MNLRHPLIAMMMQTLQRRRKEVRTHRKKVKTLGAMKTTTMSLAMKTKATKVSIQRKMIVMRRTKQMKVVKTLVKKTVMKSKGFR